MIAEYRWLPNSLTKGVPLPPLVHEEGGNGYGGYYNREKIVVCDDDPATIAHEVMHVVQYHAGRLGHGYLNYEAMYEWHAYHKEIYRYFTSYPWEMEALLCEYKICPSEHNEYWLKGILGYDCR